MTPMRVTLGSIVAFWLAVWLVAWSHQTASAQSLPRAVTLGTTPPGTVTYALASGLAKVASEATRIQVVVQPYSGTSTSLPLANSGELDFSVGNAVDMALAYQGPERLKVGGRNPLPHAPNVRLVMRGSPFAVGLVVRKDSSLRSIHDARGKRVTGEYPAHLAVWYNMYGILASAGLTWNDVRVIPVPTVNDGVDALVQGRADLTVNAPNSAKVREADAAVGVRFISMDCSPQGEERLRKAVPGYYPLWVKGGTAAGFGEDTCVVAYDYYLLTHRAASDPVVAAVLKGIWDNVDKLPALHPVLKDWTQERAIDPDMTIPYHPGAMQFYRERGLWPARLDETQRRLLALNP